MALWISLNRDSGSGFETSSYGYDEGVKLSTIRNKK